MWEGREGGYVFFLVGFFAQTTKQPNNKQHATSNKQQAEYPTYSGCPNLRRHANAIVRTHRRTHTRTYTNRNKFHVVQQPSRSFLSTSHVLAVFCRMRELDVVKDNLDHWVAVFQGGQFDSQAEVILCDVACLTRTGNCFASHIWFCQGHEPCTHAHV